MVRAIAKSGPREGQPLWRCSDFNCPTLINIDASDATPSAPVAGQSAQAQFERERARYAARMQRLAVLLVSLAILVGFGSFLVGAAALADVRVAAAVAFFIFVAATWALFHFLPNEVTYWRQGAEAERRVGAKLESLAANGFVTLYDRRMPGRGGNIDAVTIGPPGVYVVETKHRGRAVEVIQGRFEVGGKEQTDAIRQVMDQALLIQVSVAQAMNRHRLTVVPILCIGNRSVGGGERSGGVWVLDVGSVAKQLASEPPVLSPSDVQELAGLLDRALPAYERRT